MNREQVNRLLQTRADAKSTERFVLAPYERKRISLQVTTDAARERGAINRTWNQSRTTGTRHADKYPATELPVAIALEEQPMSAQSLQNYNTKGTDRPTRRRTTARDDSAVLAAAKRGDSAAFEILCKQSTNTVFHLARRMMRNNEDAQDVVQESFQQAFIHLKSFNGDSRFSTWLSRIAINAALMKLRKKHRLWDVSLDESAETEQSSSHLDVEEQGLNPEQLYAQKEQQRILSDAIKELTPGMRKAVELCELDERSTEETARIMGISVSAVMARLFHGRRKLRERLKRYIGSAWTYGRDASQAIGNTRRVSQDPAACNACD